MSKNINFELYHKNVKVKLKTGEIIEGYFEEDFEDEKEIMIGLTIIKYDEIEKMEELQINKV